MQSVNQNSVNAKENSLPSGNTVGQLLVDSGKIKVSDIEQIMTCAKEKNIRFGDAAVALKLLKEADIKYVLSEQYSYDYLNAGEGDYSKSLVAAYKPFCHQVEVLRAIRTQLMLRHFNHDNKLLMISSAESGEGKSYIAANLAIVFSQLGQNTLLVDGNLRNPSQCELFNLGNETGLTTILSGRDMSSVIKKIPEFKSLSVLTSGPVPPNPSELLSGSRFKTLLKKLKNSFDVILLDTSAASDSSDNEVIAAQVGAVMMVANKNKTNYEKFKTMIEHYQSYNIDIVGSVLNKI